MHEVAIYLLVGLVGLCLGADFLVRGAKNIASHLGISNMLVGLALVSIGTSVPEIAVSITGGINRLHGVESSGIVVGNAIGSALSQVTILIGILAFFATLRMDPKVVKIQGSFLLAATLMIFALGVDGTLSRLDGIFLLVGFICYFIFLLSTTQLHKPGPVTKMNLAKDLSFVFFGSILVWITSDVVVENGIKIAELFGVSQSLIGILLIGVGTGLPELSVAIAGIRQKAMDISLGNLVGSNICDLMFSLGLGTTISGFNVDPISMWFDIPVLLLFSYITIRFFRSGAQISKREGSILVGLFVLYGVAKVFVTG